MGREFFAPAQTLIGKAVNTSMQFIGEVSIVQRANNIDPYTSHAIKSLCYSTATALVNVHHCLTILHLAQILVEYIQYSFPPLPPFPLLP
jgi:hypothetical protein